MGVDLHEGRPRFGAEGVAAGLAEIAAPAGTFARMPDLRVQTDSREQMAWFATHLELFPLGGVTGEPERLRMSGVFRKLEGEWRMVNLHLSRAADPAEATRPAPAPAPAPAPGAAPPGGG